jgi:hypothetical protein
VEELRDAYAISIEKLLREENSWWNCWKDNVVLKQHIKRSDWIHVALKGWWWGGLWRVFGEYGNNKPSSYITCWEVLTSYGVPKKTLLHYSLFQQNPKSILLRQIWNTSGSLKDSIASACLSATTIQAYSLSSFSPQKLCQVWKLQSSLLEVRLAFHEKWVRMSETHNL